MSTTCSQLAFAICLSAATIASAKDFYVINSGQLQSALNGSVAGDTVTLQSGAKFPGSFYLQPKGSEGLTTIRSSGFLQPTSGQRVRITDSSRMATILAPGGRTAFTFAAGADNYRISGLEITSQAGQYGAELIYMDGAQPNTKNLPQNIEIDHCYLHGDATAGSKGGVAANGVNVFIHDNYFTDFTSTWQDTNAIAVWNTPGPIHIWNNNLEASGVNVIFGGAVPSARGVIPSNLFMSGNRLGKKPAWIGAGYIMKGLLEFKMGINAEVHYNWLELAQNGYGNSTAVVITPRTELGALPWDEIRNITFEKNVVTNCNRFLTLAGADDQEGGKVQRTFEVTVRNNAITRIDHQANDVSNSPQGFIFDHNLLQQSGVVLGVGSDQAPVSSATGFRWTNNIVALTDWGIQGNSVGGGTATLQAYFPGWVATNNAFYGTHHYAPTSIYPTNNWYLGDGTAQVTYSKGRAGIVTNIPGLSGLIGTDGLPVGPNLQ